MSDLLVFDPQNYDPFDGAKTVTSVSLSAPKIELLGKDGQAVSTASGAFFSHGPKLYLITNWHNLSGLNPLTGNYLTDAASVPSSVRVVGRRMATESINVPHEFELQLALPDGPLWFEHPSFGRAVDVAACEIPAESAIGLVPCNRQTVTFSVALASGDELFVLGYPIGISGGLNYPIWKRASIASEPYENLDGLPKYLIDCGSRRGMSGAPVIFRSHSHLSVDNKLAVGHTAQLFYGIYSGRLPEVGDSKFDPVFAQLGQVWKPSVVREIVTAAKRAVI